MKVLVFLVLAVASVSASARILQKAVPIKDIPQNNIEGRITNGYPAYEGKVPYIVHLLFEGDGRWFCGGSIIGNTWVLTAAHCTNSGQGVTIYYGASWRQQAQYTHWVTRGDFVQHPNYNSDNLNNDIALIRTPHVDFWSLVNKVELPSFNDRYNSFAGWWAVASGWGKTSDNSGNTDYLNCVDLQIMENSECQSVYGTGYVTNDVICVATPDGKATCSGDSGGPLVLHDGNRLVGIVSFGPGQGCQSGLPDGLTRVTSYLEWIRDNTGISY